MVLTQRSALQWVLLLCAALIPLEWSALSAYRRAQYLKADPVSDGTLLVPLFNVSVAIGLMIVARDAMPKVARLVTVAFSFVALVAIALGFGVYGVLLLVGLTPNWVQD